MPLQPLRFIHACDILVDHQLRDLGTLERDAKAIAVAATVTSFERIIEASIDHDVDFLLITGGTFDERDRSLRTRVAILDGLDSLQEVGIPVYILPGTNDSAAAWKTFGELPENVTLLDSLVDAPTAVLRDDRVIATLSNCDVQSVSYEEENLAGTPRPTVPTSIRRRPLHLGVIPPLASTSVGKRTIEHWLGEFPVDYLAVPSAFKRLSVTRGDRIAHCPGAACSFTKHDVGPLGCTLVEVNEQGQFSHSLIATSPVRRERFAIDVDDSSSWDSLIGEMHEWLKALEQRDVATMLIVDWTLTGNGSLFDSLTNKTEERELFELLAADEEQRPDRPLLHRLQLVRRDSEAEITDPEETWVELAQTQEVSVIPGQPNARGLFGKGFFARLDDEHSIVRTVIEQTRKKTTNGDSPWLRRLEAIGQRVDEQAVVAQTRKFGTDWFVRIDTADVGED